MKRLSIALAAIGISAGAFAAVQAGSMPTEVTVPQNAGGFYIGALGNFVQPSASDGDLSYASNTSRTVGVAPLPAFTTASSLDSISPKFNWGVGGKIGYDFPGTGNNVEVDYYHLFRTTSNANDATATPTAIVLGNAVLPSSLAGAGTFTTGAGSSSYRLDQVDLLAGQYINVGCRLSLHPFVGVRFDDLKRNETDTYANPTIVISSVSNTNTATITDNSEYDGVGPLVGIDASYFIASGFGAEASVDVAGLYGTMKDNSNVTENAFIRNGVLTSFSNATYVQPNTHRFVPVVDAKVGLNYTVMLGGSPVAASNNSSLTLAAGWQTSTYFNAVDRLYVNAPPTTVPAIGGNGTIIAVQTSNVSFAGPYATLTYHM